MYRVRANLQVVYEPTNTNSISISQLRGMGWVKLGTIVGCYAVRACSLLFGYMEFDVEQI